MLSYPRPSAFICGSFFLGVRREELTALLEVAELVVARAARAEEHDIAGGCDGLGLGDGGFQVAALVARGALVRGGVSDERRDLRAGRSDAQDGLGTLAQSCRERGER